MSAGGASPRVAVVGGGVIGVCCAYWLAKAGARVTLLERGTVGGEASWGNAGTVSAGHPPLNRPGRVREALGRMFDPSSPLHIPPRWDPELWRWLATFARSCTRESFEHAISVMAPMGHRTLELFAQVVEEEALDCRYRRDGYYDICKSDQGLRSAVQEADAIRPHGYRPEVLDPAALESEEPSLARGWAGGVYYPDAATVDPAHFVLGLARAAVRTGVELREGVEVVSIEGTETGRVTGVRLAGGGTEGVDAVVLATGPFSLQLAARAGVRIPVQPGKGYHRDVPVGPGGAPPLRIACVLHESSVFCTPLGDRVRFAGTMEFSGVSRSLRPERLAQLTRAAREAFPGLGSAAPVSEWSGLRPVSADGLPIVGPVPGVEGAWLATGHGMLGLTLGPVTGAWLADALLGGGESPRLLALSPARFHP